MFRYIALLWDIQNIADNYAVGDMCRRLRSLGRGWHPVLRAEGLRVLAAGLRPGSSEAFSLQSGQGVVLGALFERRHEGDTESRPRKATLLPQESDAILDSKGELLVEKYWGRYVAFLCDRDSDRKWVVRDPAAALPCYVAAFGGLVVVFSCIADLLEIQLREFSVNWSWLTLSLGCGSPDSDETALREVSELRGGYRLEVHRGRTARTRLWQPLDIARSKRIDDVDVALSELRSTVMHSVHAWASCYGGLLHRLSGGLDSSIVLGCLKSAATNPRIISLTYSEPREGSPERFYARMAAADAGCEFVERNYDHAFDFQDLLDIPPSVNPAPHLAFLQTSRIEQQLAREMGASAVFDGYGGDLLFGSVTREYAAADYVTDRGADLGLFAVAHDVALVTNRSIWRVLARARRGQCPSAITSGFDAVLTHRKFVSQALRERAGAALRELGQSRVTTRRASAGTAAFAALLGRPSTFHDPLASPCDSQVPELVSPLMSQPVMEAAIRIPTYRHFLGGRDRALAREAFAGRVPAAILGREWKDYPAGSSQKVLQRNLRAARELLLDGILLENGLLDRTSIEQALSGKPSRSDGYVTEIYGDVLVEAWLRQWTRGSRRSLRHGAAGDVERS